MTKDDLIRLLDETCHTPDTEANHLEADHLLIQYINDPEIAEAYDRVCKWSA